MIDVLTSKAPRPASGGPAPAALAPPRLAAVWRAMLWKECHEMGLLAAIMAVVVGTVLGWLVVKESYAATNPNMNGNYLTAGDAFLNGATTILAPLAALLLGFSQFTRESRPDRFGFVVHRPVSRAQLFCSKIVTGLALYLAAMLLPSAIAMAWASRPYNIPLPFTWEMALPVLSDIAAGIPFYFAGILVARRSEAGWVGSRLLPAAAPLLSAAASYAVPGFGWSLLFSLVASAIVITPAYGLYVAGGQYRPLRWPAKSTLGLLLCVTLIMIGALAVSLLEELLRFNSANLPYESTSLEFDKNGNPVIFHQTYGNDWYVTNLQGTPIPKPDVPRRTAASSDMLLPTSTLYPPFHYYLRPHDPGSYFEPLAYLPDGTTWYRRASADGDYLVGYQRIARRRVGAIGANGFEPGIAFPQARFSRPLTVVTYSLLGSRTRDWLVAAGDTLYHVTPDLKLEPMYKAREPIRQMVYRSAAPSSDPDGYPSEVFPVLQTDNQVIILSSNPQPKPLVQFALEHPDQWSLQVARIPAAGTFAILKNPYPPFDGTRRPHVYYFDTQGQLARDVELPYVGPGWTPRHKGLIDYAVPALAPPAFVNFACLVDAANMEKRVYHNDPKVAEGERNFERFCMVLSSAVGLVSALGLLLLTRWRQLPRRATWFWSILGLLLGPVAYPLLLCTRGLPKLAPCAACHKAIAVTDTTCPHCHTPVPAPPKNGTEIFA